MYKNMFSLCVVDLKKYLHFCPSTKNNKVQKAKGSEYILKPLYLL